MDKKYFPLLAILILNLLSISLVTKAEASSNITASLVLSSSDYPNVSDWIQPLPTIYANWRGKDHIFMVIWDRIRDYGVTDQVYNDYTFSTLNTAPTNEYKCILKTVYWNVSDELFSIRIYHGNDSSHLGIYDLSLNMETKEVTKTFIKYVSTSNLDISATTVKYSNYKDGYIYFSTNNVTDNYICKLNVSADTVEQYATGMGEYFVEPSPKYFTVNGYEYMFLGKHLAGDVHRYVSINNFTMWSLESQGGGSPRSNIGAPFKTSSMNSIYWPLTGGGVDAGGENHILWYATNNQQLPTKMYETTFPLATFPMGTETNVDPWAFYVIAKLSNGKYLTVGNLNPDNYHAWFILDTDFTLDEYGVFAHIPADSCWMYNAYPEYTDKTNYPLVNKELQCAYVLSRVQFGSVYQIQLWKIDFSSLSISEWNEYGYFSELRTGTPEEEPKLNLYLLPSYVGNTLGIGYMGGGLVLSSILILGFMIPVLRGRNILLPVIVGFVALGLLTYLGWLPFWILLMVILTVAGLWASGISRIFQR